MPRRLRPIGHDDRLNIVDHLDELRSRLIVCGSVLVVVFALCFAESPRLLNVLNAPLKHLPKNAANHIGGVTGDQVGERTDRVINDAITADGDVLIVAHGHILRVLGARWIGAPVPFGGLFKLAPATISELGHEHGYRAIERWNAPASVQ